MKKLVKALIISILIGLVIQLGAYGDVSDKIEVKEVKTALTLNNGQKWRIGYCESQPYFEFAGILHGLVNGLENMGWLENTSELPFIPFQEDTSSMWQWLSSNDLGPYIEFVEDAHYDLSVDSGDEIIKRLQEDNDIDLMIVNGTLAGLTLANDKHSIPSLVFGTSNAVKSGIIKSEDDSGINHIWAHVDPGIFIRQVEVFYDIFHFKKLGILYINDSFRKAFAAVDDVESVALDKGFELIHHHKVYNPDDLEGYLRDVLEAHKKLSQEVDAMYVTNGAWQISRVYELLEPFYEKKIPVFSQVGSGEVKHGALMSLARANFSGIGSFGAQTIAAVFNGTPPRNLKQHYEDAPSIAINLEVAKAIDYKPPFEILLVADEIYLEIER
ncbi:MAG: hypothetical protein VR72_02640 [Clostridiaceae bacterium BRH_c20a]|nr:MAG: hypothetical protein VR72_02640 [Clostridiaceae bacterium BRH_c20a]